MHEDEPGSANYPSAAGSSRNTNVVKMIGEKKKKKNHEQNTFPSEPQRNVLHRDHAASTVIGGGWGGVGEQQPHALIAFLSSSLLLKLLEPFQQLPHEKAVCALIVVTKRFLEEKRRRFTQIEGPLAF